MITSAPKSSMRPSRGMMYGDAIFICEVFASPPRELLSILFSNRAAAKLECQDYSGAVEDARAASTLNEKNFKAYYREPDALKRLGDRHHLAGACQAARRALKLEPENQQVKSLGQEVQQLYKQAGGCLATLDPILDSEQLQDFVKPAVEMFKAAEHSYLLSLHRDRQREWVAPHHEHVGFLPHHYYEYGQVALTLAGIKPVTLFAHCRDPEYAQEIAQTVMQPVMQQFQLEQKGFQLLEIKHELLTSNPEHPGFQGGWVLVNTNHPEFDLVKSVFLQPWPGGRVPEKVLGRAFGYPLPAGRFDVDYLDATEAQTKGLCCVPIMDFCCPASLSFLELNRLSRHMLQCARVFELLGRQLKMASDQYDELGTYQRWLDVVASQHR